MAPPQPILRDFPSSFETDRLLIRSPRPGDGAELNAALRESWPDLQPWMLWAAGDPPSVDESEATMRRAHATFQSRDDLWLLLFLKGTATLVGSSGLHVRDWSVPRFEIGYWVRSRFAGQGFVTEAVLAITAFGFEQLEAERLEIRCDSRNERSAAVTRRAGFTLEGALRHDTRVERTGELRDTLLFSRLRGDL